MSVTDPAQRATTAQLHRHGVTAGRGHGAKGGDGQHLLQCREQFVFVGKRETRQQHRAGEKGLLCRTAVIGISEQVQRDVLPFFGFTIEERTFAFNAPAITGKAAVVAHNAMAGNGDGNGIGGTGTRDGPHGLWCTDPIRNVGVAGGAAGRNGLQCLPYALLESGAANIEGKVESDGGCFNKSDHLGDDVFKTQVTTNERGLGEAVLEIVCQCIGIIAHENGANAAFTLRYQNGTQ